MSRAKKWMVGQLSRPHGTSARLVALLLNSGNKRLNAETVAELAPEAGDRILDVGFGGGVGLRSALTSPAASVTGLEISREMVARARRVFSKYVASGRLTLEEGSVDDLPSPDASFDGAYSVNCIYFWPDPIRGLEEIRRVLTDGGRCVLGVDPRSIALFDSYGFRGFAADDAEAALVKAGFFDTRAREVRRNLWVVTGRSG